MIALGRPVKVIVETGYYAGDDAVLVRAVDWCAEIGAFAIKTSTGFLQNLDNAEKRRHVRLWSARIAEHAYPLEIKDAGGKRTREDVDAALAAGADIIGASTVIGSAAMGAP